MSRLGGRAALALLCLGVGATFVGCDTRATGEVGGKSSTTAMAAPSPVDRGKYLVTILACNECHTPLHLGPNGPEPDMARMLSGHPESMVMPPAPKLTEPWLASVAATNTAFAGPWGVTYSPNLTPDQNTGLGIWTQEMFFSAMRTGRHMGTSRQIQPPMPWQYAGQMTDDDLAAIFAYLKSIPALVNHVPDYAPPPEAGN